LYHVARCRTTPRQVVVITEDDSAAAAAPHDHDSMDDDDDAGSCAPLRSAALTDWTGSALTTTYHHTF
jgi:hypothetical protein